MNYRGLDIPFTSFGNVTSDDLFADKEQEIFDFYERNATRYKRAADIGANIGVHSILMARQGWRVSAYEPDPRHFMELVRNVDAHGVNVGLYCAAVSYRSGIDEFTRVLGNTTGSHLSGLKEPYGELEKFTVFLVNARDVLNMVDFAKVDAEGAEAHIVMCFKDKFPDLMVEVGSESNARRIYSHLQKIQRRSWSQKTQWREVKSMDDMPTHHSHGALFIGEERP